MKLDCIMVDVLHAVDLGITLHIIGNIFLIYFCFVARYFRGGAIKNIEQNDFGPIFSGGTTKTKRLFRVAGFAPKDLVPSGGQAGSLF